MTLTLHKLSEDYRRNILVALKIRATGIVYETLEYRKIIRNYMSKFYPLISSDCQSFTKLKYMSNIN